MFSVASRSPNGHKLGVFCEQKILLTANYGAAVAVYAAAASELEKGMIRDSKEVYAERRQAVEVARILCEAALKELDAHVFADGC